MIANNVVAHVADPNDFVAGVRTGETFSSFAGKLAREIAERCALTGKQVLEIACRKGEFLCELCSVSGASGIGIDPCYRSDAKR